MVILARKKSVVTLKSSNLSLQVVAPIPGRQISSTALSDSPHLRPTSHHPALVSLLLLLVFVLWREVYVLARCTDGGRVGCGVVPRGGR